MGLANIKKNQLIKRMKKTIAADKDKAQEKKAVYTDLSSYEEQMHDARQKLETGMDERITFVEEDLEKFQKENGATSAAAHVATLAAAIAAAAEDAKTKVDALRTDVNDIKYDLEEKHEK